MRRTTIDERFDPEKYGMIFCPDCRGSGKVFHEANGWNVCQMCGGFGLIRKKEENNFDDNRMRVSDLGSFID